MERKEEKREENRRINFDEWINAFLSKNGKKNMGRKFMLKLNKFVKMQVLFIKSSKKITIKNQFKFIGIVLNIAKEKNKDMRGTLQVFFFSFFYLTQAYAFSFFCFSSLDPKQSLRFIPSQLPTFQNKNEAFAHDNQ